MKASPSPEMPSKTGFPSLSVIAAPENFAGTAACDKTEEMEVPSGSSAASSENGSSQPFAVVKRPGSCSRGHVRVQTSCDPVSCPNEKGFTRLEITVV